MNDPLFSCQSNDDSVVNKYVEEFYNRLVAEKKIDVLLEKGKIRKAKDGKDIQKIDVNSIKNKDFREIGA